MRLLRLYYERRGLLRQESESISCLWWRAAVTGAKPSESSVSSRSKHVSYKYAMARMDMAIEKRFFLEAVMIAESIISDRLLSATTRKRGGEAPPNGNRTNFSRLIAAARSAGLPDDLAVALDAWRDARNEVAHSVVKSVPGTAPMRVPAFCRLAEQTARDGKQLAAKVKRWARSDR